RDDLVLLHHRVEVGVEVLDLPGDLAAHLHRGDGVQVAGGGDGGGEGTSLDLGGPVLRRRPSALRVEVAPHAESDEGSHDHEGPDPFHHELSRALPAAYLSRRCRRSPPYL